MATEKFNLKLFLPGTQSGGASTEFPVLIRKANLMSSSHETDAKTR